MHGWDYIIVGGGSAGCVLAHRLSEDGRHTVLLIEAGPRDRDPMIHMPLGFLKAATNPALGWGYQSEPEPGLNGRRLMVPRGKVLGGCSSINGMFYMRGHSLDYEDWAAAGCTGWRYDEVLPYFKRMETSWRGAGPYHGGDGPLPVVPIDTRKLLHEPLMDAAVAAGFGCSEDLAGERQEGFARGEVTIDARGRRASAATAYLRPALKRRNLTVISAALVTRVLFEQRRAVGVEYRLGGETLQARAQREVLLCGGVYNSPQLLMLSGIGPAQALRAHGIEVLADLDGVGRNLSEHPMLYLEFEAKRPVTFLRELRFDRASRSALRWALFGRGPFATQLNSGNGIIRTDPGLDRPDIQLMCNPVRMDASLWFPGLGPAQTHRFSVGVVQLHPGSRGQVSLRSADPADSPRIQFKLLSDEGDYAVMRRGIRSARRLYRSGAQGELSGAELLPGEAVQDDAALDDFIRAHLRVTQHPVGTCAMGGREAVLDPELRVRGVDALRVVDASVMPTVPGGNTNAPTMMIAEKAADLILGRPAPAA